MVYVKVIRIELIIGKRDLMFGCEKGIIYDLEYLGCWELV
jgi:septum formation inhibitor-activating ATPase MinD